MDHNRPAHFPQLSEPKPPSWPCGASGWSWPTPVVDHRQSFLASWLGHKEQAVRQQLHENCYEATAKRGTARCALAVEPCFVPLLACVVDQWEGTQWR